MRLFGLVILTEKGWSAQTFKCYTDGKNRQKASSEGGRANALKLANLKVAEMKGHLDSRDLVIQELVSRLKEVLSAEEYSKLYDWVFKLPTNAELNKATQQALEPLPPQDEPYHPGNDEIIATDGNLDTPADFDEIAAQVGNERRQGNVVDSKIETMSLPGQDPRD